MVDAQFQGTVNGSLKVGLAGVWHFARINVLPLVLVAHPTAGKHGNLKFRFAEPPIFHVAEVLGFRRSDSRRTVYGQSLGQACN